MSKVTIDTADPGKVVVTSDTTIVANGVEVPPAGGGADPVDPPAPPSTLPEITWKTLTGMPFGTRDAGSYYELFGMAAGIVQMTLTFANQVVFDSSVMYGESAGFHVCTVGAERDRWENTNGNDDIVEKIDAMGLADSDYACFPHGDNVRELPFMALALITGMHGFLDVTDRNGVTQRIKIAFVEPETSWVVTNANPSGPLKLRNAFDA